VEISTARVKELRELSGAGVMDCKRALESAQGDLGRALEVLRAQGIARAAERAGRETAEGIVEAYVHGEGRIGVLVELQCETDFVARTPEFRQLAHDVALQVAAMDPPRVDDEGEARVSDRRHDSELDQMPLLKQPFVKDSARTVGEIVQELAAKTGENVVVRRFIRYQVGS
jgi:elongation factor Ts